MLSITPIPAFSDNYIWCLSDSDSGKALVVDPGQAQPVSDFLSRHGLTLDTILVTHHHPDHVGGIAELNTTLGPLRIVAPKDSPYAGGTETVAPGDSVTWQELSFRVFATPGHTMDHLAYFCDTPVQDHPVLFCGDTLFACGCGRLFEGTPRQMVDSLSQLRELPGQTQIYCAHEYTLANLRFARSWLPEDPELKGFEDRCLELRENDLPTVPVSLAEERTRNPFLRWDDPDVMAVAQRYGQQHGIDTGGPAGVFAAVRHGKDHF